MFQARLRQLAEQSLTRHLIPLESATGPTVQIAGRRMILLSSNDYLGLATHPDVVQAAVRATQQYGTGSGASRLVCGTLPPHQQLESALASFKHTEAALVFGSGYVANMGIIPSLVQRRGLILIDRLCHGSLFDGCRLSGADVRVFRHRDSGHVESLLKRRRPTRSTLIVTDGLFSMDGDLAPLPDLAALAKRYDASLYVDDAHGTGVMGQTGGGTLEHFHLESMVRFHMGTLGKSLGSSGAYAVGPRDLVDYLINTCRPFMLTTAPTPSSMAAAAAALAVVQREPDRRARLWSNRQRLYDGLQGSGFSLTETEGPILPILIGDPKKAVSFSGKLLAQGVFAPAIRPPTVPRSTSRIRVTVTSEHTTEQIAEALLAFSNAGRDTGVI